MLNFRPQGGNDMTRVIAAQYQARINAQRAKNTPDVTAHIRRLVLNSRTPLDGPRIQALTGYSRQQIETALDALLARGEITRDDSRLHAAQLRQAVAQARQGQPRTAAEVAELVKALRTVSAQRRTETTPPAWLQAQPPAWLNTPTRNRR